MAALQRAQAKLQRYRTAALKAACEGRLVPTEADMAAQEGRTYESASKLLERILAERRAKWEAEEWAQLVKRAKQHAKNETHEEPLTQEAYRPFLPKDDKWKAKYQEPVAPETVGLPDLPEGWCWATVDAIADTVSGVTKGRVLQDDRLLSCPICAWRMFSRGGSTSVK